MQYISGHGCAADAVGNPYTRVAGQGTANLTASKGAARHCGTQHQQPKQARSDACQFGQLNAV